MREQLSEGDLLLPALRKLRPKLRDTPLQLDAALLQRHVISRRSRDPLVADQKSTIVSLVHGVSRRASRKPPCSSSTDSPPCQIETAAPNSPKRAKFSSKSGVIRAAKSSALSAIRLLLCLTSESVVAHVGIFRFVPQLRRKLRRSRGESTECRCAGRENRFLL